MRVLVACEESGVVRDAFLARGHDAISCDLEPTRSAGPHYRGDVFDLIDYPWDLAIFHPPCTHTSVSGAKHFVDKWRDGRQACGVAFILSLRRRSEHIPRVAFEQPVSIMSRPEFLGKPTQIIQPWQFGHGETKATCLWLRNCPPPCGQQRSSMVVPRACTEWRHRQSARASAARPTPESPRPWLSNGAAYL